MATPAPPKANYRKYRLIFKRPAMTSRGPFRHREVFYLFLSHPAWPGRFGVGECGPLPGLSPEAKPDFEARVAKVCDRISAGEAPEAISLAETPALAFGLDCARRDWHQGGRRRLFDTPFSRGEATLQTHGLIWMATRAEMLAQVTQKVAQGFRCLKLKVGGLDFGEELGLLADIRRHYPADQVVLRLDANGAFQADNALERLTALAEFDIFALEQPLKPGQWPALARLCATSPIDIALDEELIGVCEPEAQRCLLETVRPAYLVLKPTLLGSFATLERWVSLAEGLGIGWWVNSMLESNLGLSAICQWVSQYPPGQVQGLGTGRLFENNLPTPLRLVGAGLQYDPSLAWDLRQIDAPSNNQHQTL